MNTEKDPKELLNDLFDNAPNVDDLPDGDHKEESLIIEQAFTQGVHLLRSSSHSIIAPLASMLWDIVENKLVLVASSAGVESMSFLGYNRKEGFQQAVILIPMTWVAMLKENEILQAGAIVGVASKAIDFYNGLMEKNKETEFNERAWGYEAEFLLSIQQTFPDYKFNLYQKALMATYPVGIDSERVKSLMYRSKRVFIARA